MAGRMAGGRNPGFLAAAPAADREGSWRRPCKTSRCSPMNLPLSAPAAFQIAPARTAWEPDAAQMKRMRGLIGLFALYAIALFSVVLLSDGGDVGCILGGIAGHVFYASHKIATAWRDASYVTARHLRTSV